MNHPVSGAIELRAPVNPRDPGGEYYRLPPGASEPVKGPMGTGGFYHAAPDGAIVLWLGTAPPGATAGAGVLAEKSIADFKTKYWLQEIRAWPTAGPRWDAAEALIGAAGAAKRLLAWINHWLPSAGIDENGQLLSGESLPEAIYPRPPPGVDPGGQTSAWLANAHGGQRIMAPTLRLYIRRDAFLRYLVRCPWPAPGGWRRVARAEVADVLKDRRADWPGLIEARPPPVGLLRGVDTRNRPRRLWSSAEVLAWAQRGWQLDGGWAPAQTIDPPLRLSEEPCAPLRNLLALHLFNHLFKSRQARSSLTAVWMSSRSRALTAPAARSIENWCSVNAGAGRILGQHAGAIYVTVPEFLLPDLAHQIRKAQPLLLVPGSGWAAAENNDASTAEKAEFARARIARRLASGKRLPAKAWPDLLSYGTSDLILTAESQANPIKPAYAAPAAVAPPPGGNDDPPSPPSWPPAPSSSRQARA